MLSVGNAMSSAPIISGIKEVAEGPRQNRDDHQEDHHRGVHGEQHRVELGGDVSALEREFRDQAAQNRQRRIGKRQLPSHRERERPPHQEHKQRGDQELNPDDLMIGREDIFFDEARFVMVRVGIVRQVGAVRGIVRRTHGFPQFSSDLDAGLSGTPSSF